MKSMFQGSSALDFFTSFPQHDLKKKKGRAKVFDIYSMLNLKS